MVESQNIVVSFVIGLIVNIISFYLFTLKIINISTLAFIIIGFIIVILIISLQEKYTDLKEDLEKMKINQKRLSENLKISERLTKLELWKKEYAKKK